TSRSIADALPGTWSALLQTPTGAALRRGDSLSLAGKRTALTVPHGARVLAVSPDFRRVLIAKGDLSIWDGKTATPLRVQGYKAVAAKFAAAGDKLAVTLKDTDGSLLLGISDGRGNVSLKPVPAQSTDCSSAPAWDTRGRWVYVAPGDGSLYAV